MTQDPNMPDAAASQTTDQEESTHDLGTDELARVNAELVRVTAELARMSAEAAIRERAYAARVAAWEQHWAGVQQTAAWSIAVRLRATRSRLAPDGSRRQRLWLAAVNAFRSRRARRTGSRKDAAVVGDGRDLEPARDDVSWPGRTPDTYEEWSRWCERLRYDQRAAERAISAFFYRPLVSLLMPVYDTDPALLSRAIASVQDQFYANWELCVCDDASPSPQVRHVLETLASEDYRIKVTVLNENQGIVGASNCALAAATGEFVGLLDHDDELTPDALYEVVSALQHVNADLIYTDEDKLDEDGRRHDPFFKPAWTPDLLLSCMYTGHLSVYRTAMVNEIGGFRAGTDGSQDHDLALRFTERTCRVVHVPKVLYHWRQLKGSASLNPQAKPYAYDAAARAIQDAMTRRGIDGEVHPQPATRGLYRARRSIKRLDRVSIIIPTRDNATLLERCIASIESQTAYPNYEIVIVDNGSREEATLHYLRGSRHRVIRDDGPFNYARLNNLAARRVDGTYLVLLNDDTEVLSGEWLMAMVEHAQRPDVGAVGARLLYPNGEIQHAGVILGLGGIAGHYHARIEGFSGFGYYNLSNTVRNYSAVTAACMMIRRDLFLEMGGLDEKHLPVAFNDVDLCLRLRNRGYLVVYTPHALLRHHESATREAGMTHDEVAYMREAWQAHLEDDPYYHPCLSRTEGFALDLSKPDTLACMYSHVVTSDTVGPLSRVGPIGQEFFADAENLCAIALDLATYDRRCTSTLRFSLRASPGSHEDIRTVDADCALIRDNSFHTFFFKPLEDSRGKRFYFSVEVLGPSTAGEITVWKCSDTDVVAGPYFKNRQPRQGTLSFRAYYHAHAFRTSDRRSHLFFRGPGDRSPESSPLTNR